DPAFALASTYCTALNTCWSSTWTPSISTCPPAAPCHALDPLFDEETMFFRADQPGATQDTYWENGNASCYNRFPVGYTVRAKVWVPVIVLNAHSLEDALGHDFIGRASREGSFLFGRDMCRTWRSCQSPGDGWENIYDLANRSDIVVTISSTGGYVMDSGVSLLSRHHGLAVDNLQMYCNSTLVDAFGKKVITNAHRNSDLFWCLRGGGEVIHKTYPAYHNILAATLTISAPNSTELASVLNVYLDLQPSLDDAQWWLTTAVQQTSFVLQAAGLHSTSSTQVAHEAFQSVILAAQKPGHVICICCAEVPQLLAVHDTFFPPSSSGSPAVLALRLIPRHTGFLAYCLTSKMSLVAQFRKSHPHATLVNPGWHKALHLVIFASGWTSSTPLSTRDTLRQTLTVQTSLFEPFSEGLDVYLNEADRNDPDWPLSFWGDNYEHLVTTMHFLLTWSMSDPLGVFGCPKCVGSEVFGS
ncbi:hypothetical protein B0H14DRAFT_2923462, partial [Mycena olivaceomarginata]